MQQAAEVTSRVGVAVSAATGARTWTVNGQRIRTVRPVEHEQALRVCASQVLYLVVRGELIVVLSDPPGSERDVFVGEGEYFVVGCGKGHRLVASADCAVVVVDGESDNQP